MRIAFFVSEFPALSQPFVLNQLAGMIERGHDVCIYATRRMPVHETHAMVRDFEMMTRTHFLYEYPRSFVLRVPHMIKRWLASDLRRRPGIAFRCMDTRKMGRQARSLRLLSAALAIQEPRSYDVIHCQFGVLAPLVLRLKQAGAISGNVVVSIRGFDVTQYLRDKPDFYQSVFPQVRRFFPVSDGLKERLIQLGCPRDRIVVLRSGIDCAKFKWRERSRIPHEPLAVLSVGRLVEKKGLVYAIEAVAQLLKNGLNIRYQIAGDGPLREELQARIDHFGIGASVQLLGARTHEQIVTLLDQSHIFLAPSVTAADGDQEGIPNVVKEAMACGLPVISTRHSGIPELVSDGVSGFLVPERDAAALAERITFLDHHPEAWSPVSRAARSVIERDYDQKSLTNQLENCYRSVLYENC